MAFGFAKNQSIPFISRKSETDFNQFGALGKESGIHFVQPREKSGESRRVRRVESVTMTKLQLLVSVGDSTFLGLAGDVWDSEFSAGRAIGQGKKLGHIQSIWSVAHIIFQLSGCFSLGGVRRPLTV